MTSPIKAVTAAHSGMGHSDLILFPEPTSLRNKHNLLANVFYLWRKDVHTKNASFFCFGNLLNAVIVMSRQLGREE